MVEHVRVLLVGNGSMLAVLLLDCSVGFLEVRLVECAVETPFRDNVVTVLGTKIVTLFLGHNINLLIFRPVLVAVEGLIPSAEVP